MNITHRRLAASLAVTVGGQLALATSASAESWQGNDPAHDHVPATGEDFNGYGDIVAVRAAHAPRKVYVNTTFRTGPYDESLVFYDVNPRHAGAEYALYQTEWGVSLWRVGTKWGLGERVRCGSMAVERDGRVLKSRVDRGCLRRGDGSRPRLVRIAVQAADETYENADDWAPGQAHRTSPWLEVD